MTTLVPNRFLFSLEFPLRYRAAPPKLDGSLKGWTTREALPKLGDLDGMEDFAAWYACWNRDGIWLAVEVTGKRRPIKCVPMRFWLGDNVRLCTDMRDARANKRATKFCQHFFFQPQGGGKQGKMPVAGAVTVKRARVDAPLPEPGRLEVAAKVKATGYVLEGHIPADALSGFAPAEHPRIGFFPLVEDQEFGQQTLTIGDELNWHVDPSTWPTAVLDPDES